MTKKDLKIISDYLNDTIQQVNELDSKQLFVSYSEPHNFSITTKKPKDSQEIHFNVNILQSSASFYLVISSSYDIYQVLSKDPYHESLGEFEYQKQLAKALGLKNLIAYDREDQRKINEDTVITEDLELLYCGDDQQSFLMYPL